MSQETSRLLVEASQGNARASEELMALLYDELRRIAARQLGNRRARHTLQPTALVNEACLRLLGHRHADYQGRTHFLAVAAVVIRRILIQHARAQAAEKRGGGITLVHLGDGGDVAGQGPENALDLLALDDALERLEAQSSDQARVVELRFFAGMSEQQVAETLGVSERTVRRHWTVARAWLRKELSRGTAEGTA